MNENKTSKNKNKKKNQEINQETAKFSVLHELLFFVSSIVKPKLLWLDRILVIGESIDLI